MRAKCPVSWAVNYSWTVQRHRIQRCDCVKHHRIVGTGIHFHCGFDVAWMLKMSLCWSVHYSADYMLKQHYLPSLPLSERRYCVSRHHAVTLCVYPPSRLSRVSTACRIRLGSEGNVLYPVLSSFNVHVYGVVSPLKYFVEFCKFVLGISSHLHNTVLWRNCDDQSYKSWDYIRYLHVSWHGILQTKIEEIEKASG